MELKKKQPIPMGEQAVGQGMMYVRLSDEVDRTFQEGVKGSTFQHTVL